MSIWNPWRIEVGGDPVGGWLVDIHDGTYHAVYSPHAQTADDAQAQAMAQYTEKFHSPTPASQEPENIAALVAEEVERQVTALDPQLAALIEEQVRSHFAAALETHTAPT